MQILSEMFHLLLDKCHLFSKRCIMHNEHDTDSKSVIAVEQIHPYAASKSMINHPDTFCSDVISKYANEI